VPSAKFHRISSRLTFLSEQNRINSKSLSLFEGRQSIDWIARGV
jgi:hypothetical protein